MGICKKVRLDSSWHCTPRKDRAVAQPWPACEGSGNNWHSCNKVFEAAHLKGKAR